MSSMEHVLKPWTGSLSDALDPAGTFKTGGKEHGILKSPEDPEPLSAEDQEAADYAALSDVEKRRKKIKEQLGSKLKGILQVEGEEEEDTYG